ncbi:MAG TPA: hypothetical protein ENH91_16255 [Leeuwenhoekiella sp.]|nr:hypothetical protein [Leeuwenhoekiella sp.]
MIETTIQKIRKDFSDQIIFLSCHGKPKLGIVIESAKFDIDKRELFIVTFNQNIRKMDIDYKAGGNPTKWHFSGDVKLEMKRPEVKFHD